MLPTVTKTLPFFLFNSIQKKPLRVKPQAKETVIERHLCLSCLGSQKRIFFQVESKSHCAFFSQTKVPKTKLPFLTTLMQKQSESGKKNPLLNRVLSNINYFTTFLGKPVIKSTLKKSILEGTLLTDEFFDYFRQLQICNETQEGFFETFILAVHSKIKVGF